MPVLFTIGNLSICDGDKFTITHHDTLDTWEVRVVNHETGNAANVVFKNLNDIDFVILRTYFVGSSSDGNIFLYSNI